MKEKKRREPGMEQKLEIAGMDVFSGRNQWLLALTGGLLLHFSWFPHGFTPLIFIAFVPFFLIKQQQTNLLRAFGLFFVGFLLFHVLAGWWMYSSTIAGSVMAHVLNAGYMATVLVVWMRISKLKSFQSVSLGLLLLLWLGFEFLHQRWELAWPWFTIGHVFAGQTSWIQWYRFTGSLGGSAWVLVVNWLIYRVLFYDRKTQMQFAVGIVLTVVALALPVFVSQLLLEDGKAQGQHMKVVIVQPNIHPQKEKFAGMPAAQQLLKALDIAAAHLTPKVGLIVFPETMLVDALDEEQIAQSPLVQPLIRLAKNHQLSILTGAYTKRFRGWNESDNHAVINDSVPYVLYNSALLITDSVVRVYHKEKLVPLVEKQPFQRLMRPLQKFVERSGGFFGSYGTFNQQHEFALPNGLMLRPVICFESAFPVDGIEEDHPGLLAVITNDGWWKSSGGYHQHLMLSNLRAIETGLWVVRSANTGVSAVIDPTGMIRAQCAYGESGAIVYNIPLFIP